MKIFYRKICSGFSLLEIAVAIAVAGIIMAGAIQAYRLEIVAGPVRDTRKNFKTIDEALQKFLAINGRLPIPADPQAKSGKEFSLTISACSNSTTSTAGSGICYTTVARNADGISGTTDNVLIGGVPFFALGLSEDVSFDGWRHQMRYAVTEKLTNTSTYDADRGSIYVVDASQIQIMPTNITGTGGYRNSSPSSVFNATYPYVYGSANYLLLSSGINKAGAYIFTGGKMLYGNEDNKYKCATGTTVTSTYFGLDFENCNGDGYFLTDDRYSKAGGNSIKYQSDDIVNNNYFVKPYSNNEWKFSGKVDEKGNPLAVKNDKSGGRVGIGVPNPSVSLDVDGNIKVDRLYAKTVCDSSNKCISPKFFGGNNSMACSGGSGGVISGTDTNGKPLCLDTTYSGFTSSTCTTGYIVRGINTLGVIQCKAE